MGKKALAVSEFKARCLAILDEVARTGESVTVLKRGKPLARVLPVMSAEHEHEHPQRRLIGTIEIVGDVVASSLAAQDWEAERGKVATRRRRRSAKR